MSERPALLGIKGAGVESCLHDGKRLFFVIDSLLNDATSDQDDTRDRVDAVHMLAGMGRDVMAEALRAWERERAR